MLLSSVPSRPGAGNPGSVAALFDHSPSSGIGARRRAMSVVHRFGALFQAASEAAPFGLSLTDVEGRHLWVNGELSRLLDVPADALIGRSLGDDTHPEDRHRVLAMLSAMHFTGTPAPAHEARLRRRDGSLLTVRLSAFPVLDRGDVLYFGLILEDLSERCAIEAAHQADRDRFEAIVEHSAERITVLAPDWTILYVSPATRATIDARVGDRLPFDRLHPDDHQLAHDTFTEVLMDPTRTGYMVARVRMVDGGWRYLETTMTNMLDNPAVGGIVFNARDVTEQRAHQARFEAMLEHSSDLYSVWTVDRELIYMSPQSRKLLGYEAGDRFRDESVAVEDQERLNAAFLQTVAGTPMQQTISFAIRAADGNLYHVESILTNMLDNPVVGGIMINSRDVSERVRAAEALAVQAYRDALTGLPNRAKLIEHVAAALAAETPITVAMLDLDRFRLVNETQGHAAGDDLLRQIGARLLAAAAPDHLVARLGGDEFGVVVTGGDVDTATALARRLMAAVAEPLRLCNGSQLAISTSIGLSFASSGDPDTMLRHADTALYQAKDRGRDSYIVFDEVLLDRVIHRHTVEQRLRAALADGGFGVGYQPIVDLRTGAVLKAEALLRLKLGAPEVAVVDLIDVAEDSGVIFELGERMLATACHDAAGWLDQLGPRAPGCVAVNVSARQLASPGFVEQVARQLDVAGLAADRLCIEMTETTLFEASRQTVETLNELKSLGVALAIDDFGTGYSSLAYLKRFPFDYVKIDRTFIEGLGTDPCDTSIVRAVVWLAQSLGLRTVAEGVESEAQCMALRALGCDMAQGFCFSKARPDEEFVGLLAVSPPWTVS
jgi:diguanylate cyclase (GGDEF)-like protein/PAS domain S-box-containing protein